MKYETQASMYLYTQVCESPCETKSLGLCGIVYIYNFIPCIYSYIKVYTILNHFIPCYCLWWYEILVQWHSVVEAGTH
jgi:hypothetical protein